MNSLSQNCDNKTALSLSCNPDTSMPLILTDMLVEVCMIIMIQSVRILKSSIQNSVVSLISLLFLYTCTSNLAWARYRACKGPTKPTPIITIDLCSAIQTLSLEYFLQPYVPVSMWLSHLMRIRRKQIGST